MAENDCHEKSPSLSSRKISPEISQPTQNDHEQPAPALLSSRGETPENESSYVELDKMWEQATFKKFAEFSVDKTTSRYVMTLADDYATSGTSTNPDRPSPTPSSSSSGCYCRCRCACNNSSSGSCFSGFDQQHGYPCSPRPLTEVDEAKPLPIKPLRPIGSDGDVILHTFTLENFRGSLEASLSSQKGHKRYSSALSRPGEEQETKQSHAGIDKTRKISPDQTTGSSVEDSATSGSATDPDRLSPTSSDSSSLSSCNCKCRCCSGTCFPGFNVPHVNESEDRVGAPSHGKTPREWADACSKRGKPDAFQSRGYTEAERGEDIICFRGLEKLNGIARAIAETQRNSGQPDYAIVGPFSYVDVFSDPNQEQTELRMTASELEASVNPEELQSFWGEYGSDFEVSDPRSEDSEEDSNEDEKENKKTKTNQDD